MAKFYAKMEQPDYTAVSAGAMGWTCKALEALATAAPLCVLCAGFVYFGLRSVSAVRRRDRVRRVPEGAGINYYQAEFGKEWRNGSCPGARESSAGRSPGDHGRVLDQPGVCWNNGRKDLREVSVKVRRRKKRRLGEDGPRSRVEARGR